MFISTNKKTAKSIKTVLHTLLICSALSFATSASAQASKTSVLKLMEVTHMNNMMQEAINQHTLIIPSFAQRMVATKKPNLSEAQKLQLNDIINKHMKSVRSELDSDLTRKAITDIYINTAQKHFTQAEVDAQIDFYGSEMGQSIIKKHSALVNDYMIAIMPVIIEKSESKIKSVLPKLEADIDSVISK